MHFLLEEEALSEAQRRKLAERLRKETRKGGRK